jgi:hypothetical protein
MKPNLLIILLTVSALMQWSCTREQVIDEKKEVFPLYIAKDVKLKPSGNFITVPVIDHYLHIDQHFDLNEKIGILLNQLSERYFNNLDLELRGIQSNGSLTTVLVNLEEKPGYEGPGSLQPYMSWYDFFQGSHGGLNTQITLTESLLQRHRKGEWFDALVFLYRGDEFGDYDHINLKGRIFRYE